jgi:hypothetical protein
MKWFKHSADAMHDEKIEELIMEYGIEGYGVYFGIIEIIADALSSENVDFDLKHRAKVLSRRFNINYEKLKKIIDFLVEINLLQINPDTKNISCFGLLRQLDVSTSNNPEFKKIVNDSNYQKLLESNSRLDKIRVDKSRKDKKIIDKPTKHKYGEFKHVLLSDEDYKKLVELYTEQGAKDRIKNLDEYIETNNKSYNNHLLVINRWEKKDEKDSGKSTSSIKRDRKKKMSDKEFAEQFSKNVTFISTDDTES